MTGRLRITGGTLARRQIEVPAAASKGLVRPTSDKVRQAIMNMLGQSLDGLHVLDLFAGSGALALESVSRGAVRAVCVEADKKTAETIRHNAVTLGIAPQLDIVTTSATAYLRGAAAAEFDVVYVDPPYDDVLDEAFWQAVARVLAPGGRCIIERRSGVDVQEVYLPLLAVRVRDYGDTRVTLAEAPLEQPAGVVAE